MVAFLEVFLWHFSNSFKKQYSATLGIFSFPFLKVFFSQANLHTYFLSDKQEARTSRFFRKENFNFSSFCTAVIWNKWDMGKIEKSEFCHKSWFQSAVVLLKWQIIIWFQEAERYTVVETSILGIRSHAACNEMTPSHVCAHVKYKYETSKEEDLLSFFPYLTGHWRWRRANSRSRS